MKTERRLPWLRLYTEIIEDLKVQSLPNETFKFWINCLCVARIHDGILPELDRIAFLLRMRKTSAAGQLKRLVDADLIDSTEKGYVPHAWERRQYESDNSTLRVERFREAQRNVAGNVSRNVAGNGDVTPRARTQSSENRETPIVPFPDLGDGPEDLARDLWLMWPEEPKNRRGALKAVMDELVAVLSTSGPNAERDLARIRKNAEGYIAAIDDPEFCMGLPKWLKTGEWTKAPKRPTGPVYRNADDVIAEDNARNAREQAKWEAAQRKAGNA